MKIKHILPIISLLASCEGDDDGSAAAELSSSKYPISSTIESIPMPPLGQRWVLNEDLSDEFNGTSLDANKWYDYHPSWIGRPPGLFTKDEVAVKDGYLVLSCSKFKEEHIETLWNGEKLTYTIGCGAVVSREMNAHYGYYESRFKAHNTPLAAGFWMSHLSTSQPTAGNQPDGFPDGVFSQELDICETVGRGGDIAEGWTTFSNLFGTGMNYCAHCWFTPTGGDTKFDYKIVSKGNPSLKRADGRTPSDDFNTYGCWWKDKDRAEYYYNNVSSGEEFFRTADGTNFWFPLPMAIILNIETYAWAPSATDEELADPQRNRSYYDWIRHYVLKGAKQDIGDVNPTTMFTEHINLIGKDKTPTIDDGEVSFNVHYTANADCEVHVAILDSSDMEVASELFVAYGGYANTTYKIPATLTRGEKYHVVAYIRKSGSADNSAAYEGDSYEFVI